MAQARDSRGRFTSGSGNVTVRDMGWNRIKGNIRDLDGKGVKVGIVARDANKKGADGDTDVIDYAMFQEFGTEHIPSRPFMRRAADTGEPKFHKAARAIAKEMVMGRVNVDQAVGSIGQWFVQHIQGTIRRASTWAVPLSPTTVRKKKSTAPLIDHAVMVNTISWERDDR